MFESFSVISVSEILRVHSTVFLPGLIFFHLIIHMLFLSWHFNMNLFGYSNSSKFQSNQSIVEEILGIFELTSSLS